MDLSSAEPDIVFTLGPRSIAAHSLVFCARSQPFRELYQQLPVPPTPAAPLSITVPFCISSQSFDAFISYVYNDAYEPPLQTLTTDNPGTGPTNSLQLLNPPIHNVSIPAARPIPSPRSLVELYRLASDYGLPELGRLVAQDLLTTLSSETYLEIRTAASDGQCNVRDIVSMVEAWTRKKGAGAPGYTPAQTWPANDRPVARPMGRRTHHLATGTSGTDNVTAHDFGSVIDPGVQGAPAALRPLLKPVKKPKVTLQ
ncbi:hypothetical protein DFJ73DRAFT_815623 [Zopfochytrium polystomum]|nr:hypothetical protein DFJ73DRAFT_815623 [Zopfochytrium polystomum]